VVEDDIAPSVVCEQAVDGGEVDASLSVCVVVVVLEAASMSIIDPSRACLDTI
jgi:hypothetical protein